MGMGGDCLNRGLHGFRGFTLSDGQWLMTVETATEEGRSGGQWLVKTVASESKGREGWKGGRLEEKKREDWEMGMGGGCLNCDLCDYGITLIVPIGLH